MGGSGGGVSGPPPEDLRRKIDEARQKEREGLVAATNEYLNETLSAYNARNHDAIRQHIEELRKHLEGVADIEDILYGGSVAKHTDINGISDVDALVFLDAEEYGDASPHSVLESFRKKLVEKLGHEDISVGNLAVTITRSDGTEIQLLPALRKGNTVEIPSDDGKTWNRTNPMVFAKMLTDANNNMKQSLVPAIKLVKALNDGFPADKKLGGYHIEAMAVKASESFKKGPYTPRAVLLHLLDYASKSVLKPIADATGQSRVIDGDLGAAGSANRKAISRLLANTRKYLDSAPSVGRWKRIIEDE